MVKPATCESYWLALTLRLILIFKRILIFFHIQISHKFRNRHFRRYVYQHVYMIWTCCGLQYFCSHSSFSILPTSAFSFPYIICRLYFGTNTIRYLQFHFVCTNLLLSFGIKTPPDIIKSSPSAWKNQEVCLCSMLKLFSSTRIACGFFFP